ncbi:sphingomyelin phosphodiesterase 4 [Toxorhynchites rutilus septentrionalis]|uniref:sphingomyelin phosphodiesterase 4 n=1 Tax=Toxorhynchites rutilus septentrionalis TaxID=329112 RepID=UPI0024787342|nr:sphingomyelin phosphodiesterase 4 [Toxorhynchites rutilus septentrionalis]
MDSGARILEILNLPLMMRCPELGLLIDRASLRELQDIYPVLVNSIFGVNTGGTGWGFRVVTRDTHPHDFDILYNFFIPIGGPMFRLCYRLLNDSLKYELPVSCLPPKMQQLMESSRYSAFYSDIVNIDPFRRQIVSLSLNAFDYFMFNFALHGMVPAQRLCPTVLSMGNEKAKSLYLILTAEYLCTFLPSHPDSVVLPQIVGGTVKVSSPATVPVMQPTRSPKYLLLSALHHHAPATSTTITAQRSANNSAVECSSRVHCWRSESVLYIFIDCWLRLDVDDSRELPNNEFIRCVRILVKQLHAFGNSADLDNSSMALLRQSAQPLMNAKMYGFLKALIARWPLDSSFSDVLELWLSYIQPWRYTFNRDLSMNMEIAITPRDESFVAENLIVYTQIFVQLIPRFERIDLTTLRNVLMMFRLLKVFSQSNLIELLIQSEAGLLSNNNASLNTSTFNASSTPLNISSASNRSNASLSGLNRSSGGGGGEWKSLNTSGGGRPGTPGNRSGGDLTDESYVFLFDEHFSLVIQELLKKIYVSMLIARDNLRQVQREKEQRYQGVWKYVYRLVGYFDHDPVYAAMLSDRQKIPEILDVALQALARMFQIPITEELLQGESMQVDTTAPIEQTFIVNSTRNTTADSICSSQSFTISPQQMKQRKAMLRYTGDPALLPITSSEFTFLVRFLHQLSCKLNVMFGGEMHELWYRGDLWGKLSRQILSPPLVAQTFDKSQGVCVLKEDQLGPRVCLRMLASYKSLFVVFCSFLTGYVMFNAPSYGFMLLVTVAFLYVLIKSLLWDRIDSRAGPIGLQQTN